MLSLRELERVCAWLDPALRGHRVQDIVQPDDYSVVLDVYGRTDDEASRRHILLSCRPGSARVSSVPRARNAPGGPPRFAQYLRAHLKGGRIEGVRLLDGDRQLAMRLRCREGDFDLLLAIFGRRSNVVVLDAESRIVSTLRPLSATRNELSMGDPWQSPAGTAPRQGEDRFEEIPNDRLIEAIEAHYAPREADDEAGALSQRLETALRKEARNLDRKLEKLGSELAAAERATRCEREGELLKSVLPSLRKGMAEVVVQDWDSGEDVSIALDVNMTPSENLERLFKRYRKAIRTLTKGGAQLEAVRESRAAISALEAGFEAAREGGDDALAEFASSADVVRLLGKFAPGPAPASRKEARRTHVELAGRKVPLKLAPRRYRTECGLEVWVGRSDAANDFLSIKLARGNDLFFHLDGAPGSHVILRTEGRSDPPSEAILDACELSVHFSKQKKASNANVHIVPCKNVRKPKGAKPGLVTVHGGRSLHLRREEKRLERILSARLDD
jgi:predicted ribosome quality control (RQC) complex YloA/Tae2 family protein